MSPPFRGVLWWDSFQKLTSAAFVLFLSTVNSLGPLVNTLYTQLPDLTSLSSGNSNRRRSSTQNRRRTRSSTRANQQRAFSLDAEDYLPDDLGAGYNAFADMFGASSNNNEASSGVDFSSLLRTLVTEGQRQGIDGLSALRAAGRVQDELRRFQEDPSGWFEGVGERFRTPATPEVGGASGYNTRSRARQQQQRAGTRGRGSGVNGQQADSWWSNVASGINDFIKREPNQNQNAGYGGRRGNRQAYNI